MKLFLAIFILCFLSINVFSQNKIINGFIQDAKSGEKLPFSTIYIKNIDKGVLANNYGFFSITSNLDSVSLIVSYVGYIPINIKLKLKNDTSVNILLEQNNELKEIVIIGEQRKSSMKSSQFNMSSISMNDIHKIPVILGESDVLKTIQLMPGIKGGQEGTSGLYVRGGSPDQNLILLDGVPVYNANHLFGFFSVFNSEALKSINAIKGGFPSRYGGRLSSIIDIQMKEGNNQNFKGDISLGIISSKFTIEGPLKKDKTSFIISGRRTYFDFLMAALNVSHSNSDEELSSGYYFYDFNAKINHKISEKQHVFLSYYSGKDKAYFDDKFSNYSSSTENNFDLNWKNTTIAIRYNNILTPKIFMNATLIYSEYKFFVNKSEKTNTINPTQNIITNNTLNAFSSNSGIQDFGIKYDFDYYIASAHSFKYGVSYIKHVFTPEVSSKEQISGENQIVKMDTTFGNSNIRADEISAFIEDDWNLNSKLKANIGFRFSSFSVQGKNYPVIEPRLSARYLFSNKLSMKAAYSRMSQYIHLLSNSSVGLPTDLWLPATKKVKPMYSDQFALGTQYNMDIYEAIIECFYKKMYNLIEYKEGVEYLEGFGSWEEQIEIGSGNAHGFEFLFRKTTGKTTGWVGYTLSWSNRKFNNLNNGKTFPYKFDRRHDVSLVVTHKFSEKADFGLTWVFSTGNPITLPVQKYSSLDNSEEMILHYSDRNSYRMPSYHRMDIGANFYKVKKRGTRIWSISIYNLYNRLNPYYIYAKNNGNKTELRQYTLFPIMPSISYTYKF
jgi:outer membrane receptor for ferrienterochelin and colicin